jgi:general secretion pathway protein F
VMLSRTQSLLQSINSEIRGGKPLSEAIDDRKLLNPSALTMLRVGEKSGAVTKMMRYIATNSADQHRTIQRRVISLMEPASIIVIGIALGTIMIGVVLAMTSLTEIKF